MANSAFVDSSSLNVLYKQDGRGFNLALNYKDALPALARDIQALGPGYEVYLTLWPRANGDGDKVIEELSISGIPFRVNSKEYEAVCNFFMGLPGIGKLYLCNGIANYITAAKIKTFSSVFFCGKRVCYLKCVDSLVDEYEIFNNPYEFQKQFGESFNCYGDADLIDTNRLMAMYPSLTHWELGQLVGCAPLITSYRSQGNNFLYVPEEPKEETREELKGQGQEQAVSNSTEGAEKPEESQEQEAAKPQQKVRKQKTEHELIEEFIKQNKSRVPEKRDIVTPILVTLGMLLSITFGAEYTGVNRMENSMYSEGTATSITETAARYSQVANVYDKAQTGISDFLVAVEKCKGYSSSVYLTGWQYIQGKYLVTISVADVNGRDSFLAGLSQDYYVSEVTDLGVNGTRYIFQILFQPVA